ncbi:NADAR family protein [Streptomyces spirodelae]|uniref:NADAR family protein n=1 Tax=Streptomyces spirodelae TaxID=2812904 RepID=A0ABS3WYM0_9ACTN|nr:NADAR family protein [Streptomyces spirodelae]MBO8188176.1 NADAR family protein [Streptomyces spirodelae]
MTDRKSDQDTKAEATSAPITLPRSVEEGVTLERSGHRLRFLFFWGNQRERDGSVGRGCLSQWWESPFPAEGHTFRSAEHYMMAHKAWLFGDDETAERILATLHPGEAKALGRQVRGFEEDAWREHRYGIVVRGNIAKFSADPELRSFLLKSRDRVLVEASPLDRVWGIGLAATDERAHSPSSWRGLNLLGFALMEARNMLASR